MKGTVAIIERELPALLRMKQTLWIFAIVALTFSATGPAEMAVDVDC